MFHYLCWPGGQLGEAGYHVEAVQPLQVESIRLWRNAQLDVLRQSAPLGQQEQAKYFDREVWPEMQNPHPGQVLVGIHFGKDFIGYGGLVHISWAYRRAEISFLTKPERNTPPLLEADFRIFLKLIQKLAFRVLGLHKLTTETYGFRTTHLALLDEAGFQREGLLRQHVLVAERWFDAVLHGKLLDEWKE